MKPSSFCKVKIIAWTVAQHTSKIIHNHIVDHPVCISKKFVEYLNRLILDFGITLEIRTLAMYELKIDQFQHTRSEYEQTFLFAKKISSRCGAFTTKPNGMRCTSRDSIWLHYGQRFDGWKSQLLLSHLFIISVSKRSLTLRAFFCMSVVSSWTEMKISSVRFWIDATSIKI